MANETYNNIQDFFQQAVMETARPLFENNTPTFSMIKENTEEFEIIEGGWRLPNWATRPGGHGAYIPSAPDFNAAIPPQTNSMFIYPTGYSLPAVMDGAVIRGIKARQKGSVITAEKNIKWYTDAAAKRMNYITQGDGTGALAYSSSTLSAGAGQTMNCTTTASTTAGQTKGAVRLELNNYYQAINTSTAAVRGTILVTATGKSSCTVTVLSGSVSANDPIVDIGSYLKYFRGLAWIISGQSRVFQGVNTANNPDYNSPQLDLVNRLFTPADFETLKAMLRTRNNDPNAANRKKCVMTGGAYSDLCKQGYGYRQYVDKEDTVQGVAKKYTDGDTDFELDADADDDRRYIFAGEDIARFTEMPFGIFDLDGLTMRMQMGANGTGSDSWQMAYGFRGNIGLKLPRSAALAIRCATANVVGQTTTGV
jgi:hypothetical protein